VPLRGVGGRPLEPPEHALELRVVEQVGPAAGCADQVVTVLAAGQDELVARLSLTDVQPAHEAALVEQPQGSVDGRGADAARRPAQRIRDLLRAQPSALAVEQRDDGTAGAAAAVAGLPERPARPLGPGHAGSALRAAPRTR
jgi:hypothetical protein